MTLTQPSLLGLVDYNMSHSVPLSNVFEPSNSEIAMGLAGIFFRKLCGSVPAQFGEAVVRAYSTVAEVPDLDGETTEPP